MTLAKCNWCDKVIDAIEAWENAEGEYFCSNLCRQMDKADTEKARKEQLGNM